MNKLTISVIILALFIGSGYYLIQRGQNSNSAIVPISKPAQNSFMAITKPAYTVGDKFVIMIENVPPVLPIYWTKQVNTHGDIFADRFQEGETDASGRYVLDDGIISDNQVGIWTVAIEVGNKKSSLIFSVNPTSDDDQIAIYSLSNYQGVQGGTFTFYIEGKNFDLLENSSSNGVSPISDRGFEMVTVKKISNFEIEATYRVSNTATPGPRYIRVGDSNAEEFKILKST